MGNDLTEILWWHDSYFIKKEDREKETPKEIHPVPIGEPFKLYKIYDIGKDLDEKIKNSIKVQMNKMRLQANAYCKGIFSKGGFCDSIYQAYKI